MRKAKALVSMYIMICADVSEQSLLTDARSIDISCKLSDPLMFSWRNQKTFFHFGYGQYFPGILACIDDQHINLFLDMSNDGIFLFFYSISIMFVCLICFFTSHQQSFSYKGTGLPGLNQY